MIQSRNSASILLLFALLVPIAAMVSSCGEDHLSGRVFLNTKTGIVVPIPDLKIVVFKLSEFDKYLAQRSKESHAKRDKLRPEIESLKKQLSEAQEKCGVISESNKVLIQTESYLDNDEQYNSLMRELNELPQKLEAATKSLNALVQQYGQSPTISPLKYSAAQQKAYAVERSYQQQISTFNLRASKLPEEIKDRDRHLRNSIAWTTDAEQQQVWMINHSLSEMEGRFFEFQSVKFYLEDFDPSASAIIITDKNGYFTIQNIHNGECIFAKLIIPGTEPKYWVVKPPFKSSVDLTEANVYSLPEQEKEKL